MASSHAADMAHLAAMREQRKLMEEIRDLMKIMVDQKRTDEDRTIAQADAIRLRRKKK